MGKDSLHIYEFVVQIWEYKLFKHIFYKLLSVPDSAKAQCHLLFFSMLVTKCTVSYGPIGQKRNSIQHCGYSGSCNNCITKHSISITLLSILKQSACT